MISFHCQGEESLSSFTKLLWAKGEPNPKSLWHHMLDAGICAACLTEELRFHGAVSLIAYNMALSVEETKRFIAYTAACHDMYGKAAPAFQKKLPELARPFSEAELISPRDRPDHFRHERYGKRQYQAEASGFHIDPLVCDIISTTIKLHHQRKHRDIDAEREATKAPLRAKEKWKAMGNELHAAVLRVFDPPLEKMTACRDVSAVVMALLPLVILSDWLASSSPFSEIDETLPQAQYMAASRKVAEETVKLDGLVSCAPFPAISEYRQLWPRFRLDQLRPVQRAILSDADPEAGLTIIEAPMGEGKTEAGAFQAARACSIWGKQGIYVALPTAATSNQMHGRIEDMLSSIQMSGPRLMHGMAWLAGKANQSLENQDMDDLQAAYDWLRPLRRAMLAENAVGTVDQAMLSVMPVKYSCLRLLGLTGKALVIDEIHAYDAYMSEIIERLLTWCRTLRIPVILLSATLTQEKRKKLVEAYGGILEKPSDAYPLITQVTEGKTREIPVNGCTKTGCFHFRPIREEQDKQQIAHLALGKIEHGGCLCVLMNTVGEAQNTWQAIREAAPDDVDVMLFHARFKAKERDAIEKRCLRLFGKDAQDRPAKAILVCTQVVEQSLDLDFDGMITQLAPIDLLLQRAGRVHRHDRGKRPLGLEDAVIDVLIPENEDRCVSSMIYAPWLLTQTKKLMPVSVRIPEDVRSVIETVYQQPDKIEESFAAMKFSDQMAQAQAGANMLPMPETDTFFDWESETDFDMEEPEENVAARTRLADASIRVSLLPRETIEQILAAPRDGTLARQAFENSFTIREKTPKKNSDNLQEGSGLCRNLWLIPEEKLPIRINDTLLQYDPQLGAITERKLNQ